MTRPSSFPADQLPTILTAAIALSWLPRFLANYPAVMTPDSIDQWGQAVSGHFNDWHPIAYALALRATQLAWASPAAMVLLQSALLLGAIAWGLLVLRDTVQAPPLALVAVAASFIVLPAHAAIACTLWKDVPYAAALLTFSLALLRWTDQRGPFLARHWMLLVAAALGMILLRHNGFLSVAAGLAAMAWFAGPQRRRVTLCAAAILVATAGWRCGILTANIPRSPVTEKLAIPLQQTAAIVASDGRVSESERTRLDAILPWATWRAAYNRVSVDPLKFHPYFNGAVINRDPAAFLRLWLGLVLRNPGIAATAWLRQTMILWHPRLDGGTLHPTGIVPNAHGLAPAPRSPRAVAVANRWQQWGEHAPWCWPVRPAVIHATLVAAAAFCVRSGRRATLLPFVPWAVGVAGLFLFLPTPDFRYFYPGLALAPFLLVHAWRSTATARVLPV